MGKWVWHKVMREELARFVSTDSTRWILLPVDREAVLARQGGRRELVHAIYDALAALGVRYAPERYNPAAKLQEVRQPDEVLNRPKEGTCLDLAAVFCGICEGNELLPLLIVLESHALAAVSLTHGLRDWDAYDRAEQQLFETGVLYDWAGLARLLRDGSYVAVECTGFTRQPQDAAASAPVPSRLTFDQAVTEGMRRLATGAEFAFALDIAIARWNWQIETAATTIHAAVMAGRHLTADHVLQVMRELGNTRAVDRLVKVAGTKLGASEKNFKAVVGDPPDVAVLQQAAALAEARESIADAGARLSPESEFQLGRLAALRRDYDVAERHLRRAVDLNPKSSEALESLLWLTQARAMHEVQQQNGAAALLRLREADRLGRRLKNQDIDTMRGYIRKTLAQVAQLAGDKREERKCLKRAALQFDRVLVRSPSNASALNGRANVKHLLGDLAGAKIDYLKAIRSEPNYAAPHHDVALLLEECAKLRPGRKSRFLAQALDHWTTCRTLAKEDPLFSNQDIARIGGRIRSLRASLKGGGWR
jgi:tetratricopeptide (TPR) repeat protein